MLHKPHSATQKLATTGIRKLGLKDKQHLREANRSGGGIYFKSEEPTGAKAVRYTCRMCSDRAKHWFSIRGDLTPQGNLAMPADIFMVTNREGMLRVSMEYRPGMRLHFLQHTGQPPQQRFNAFKLSKAPRCETLQYSREGRFKMRSEEQAVTRS